MKPLKNILLLLLLLASCGSSERGRMLAVLDEADSLNRNYLPVTGDSMLRSAAEWFDSHGSANERMRAHYLLGCAYRDMGEAPAALQSYHDAVDCADTTTTDCDYRLLSRVHGQMADLFYWQESSANALQECIMVDKYARLAKDTMMIIANNNKRSDIYELEEKWDLLVLTQEKNAQECLRYGNKQEYAVALGGCLVSILGGNDYDKEKFSRYIEIYEDQSGLFDDTGSIQRGYEIFYYLKGLHLLYLQHKHEAEKYFRKLITSGTDLNDSLAAYRGLYLLYNSEQRIDSVAKYADLCYQYNDKSYKETCTTHIQQMQSQYDYSRHQQIALEKSEEVSKFKSILFVVIFCVICVLYCTISIIRKYNRERREMEKQHKSDVQELLLLKNEIEKLSTANLPLIIEEKTKRIHELQSKIDEYQTKNYKKLNDVNLRLTKSEIYKHFRDYCLAPHKCEITVEDWDTLVGLLNNEVPTFFQLLTVNTQSLRKLDIYLCILVRLRFQPKDISIILDISQSEVSVLRRRLLKKIFNCDGSAKDFDKKIQSISD